MSYPFDHIDRQHMASALALAQRAARRGEVPVGAVLADKAGRVLAAEHNRTISNNDPTAHAEVLCLRQAAAAMGNFRLGGVTLYATLEPCPMCAGAIVWARVARVIYGADDPKAGAYGSVLDFSSQEGLNHKPLVRGGLLGDEAAGILRDFFQARRGKSG